MAGDFRVKDGSLSFSSGINTGKTSTISSAAYPEGIKRDQLVFLNSGTVRGGGISNRPGYQPRVQGAPWSGRYQGCYMYEPASTSLTNTVTLKNLSPFGVGGTVVPTAAYNGALGTGADAFQPFVIPALGSTVVVTLKNPFGGNVGDVIEGGEFQVMAVTTASVGNPYLIASVGGRIYQIRVDTDNTVVDLSAVFGLTNPPDIEQAFFCQGEEFLVIQAGDYVTLPLFWDGSVLRRSNGNGSSTTTGGTAVIKNVNDAANVGAAIPGPQSAQYPTVAVTDVASFILPAVGGTVTVPTGSVSGTLPSGNFSLVLTTSPYALTGDLQVVSFSPPVVNTIGPELPAAGPMDYFMGRFWLAFGRSFFGSDIVKGPSGTPGPPYFQRDSVLKMTESPVGQFGDGFSLPSNAGNIRGITHTAELNTQTGEGRLYIGTRKAVYRLAVPVTRTEWIAANNSTNQPFQTIALIKNGFVSDRDLVRVNGDLFYHTIEPGIVSFALSIRNFDQWGNTAISRNLNRIMNQTDRELLHASSGIEFNNRVLLTALPFQTPVGIAHKGLVPLDLDIITSLDEKLPAAWEGLWEGLDILQLAEGDFGGLQRAFSFNVSRVNGEIQIWEITTGDKTDNGDNRITRIIETPSYTWNNPFALKQLETLELWFDKLFGTVEFEVYFRPDQHPCWIPWDAWKECAARDCSEDLEVVLCPEYPTTPYCEQYRATRTLPKPPEACIKTQHRGCNIAYQFQIKIVTKGQNRIRGLVLHALPVDKRPFEGMVCDVRQWFNVEYTPVCPEGFICDVVVVPAGMFFSTTSQADADSKAVQYGKSRLNPRPIVYYNVAQTATCPPGQFGSVTIPAGVHSSTVSQGQANQLALSAAQAQLVCSSGFGNTQQEADCPVGYSGSPVIIPANTYFAATQAEADALALAAAEAGLVCVADTIFDSMEEYNSGDFVNGLSGGTGWPGPYTDRACVNGLQAYDDMDLYADLALVNGLSGGNGFPSPYVAN